MVHILFVVFTLMPGAFAQSEPAVTEPAAAPIYPVPDANLTPDQRKALLRKG